MKSLSTKPFKNKLFYFIGIFLFFLFFGLILSIFLAGPEETEAGSASGGSTAYSASISNDETVEISITPKDTQTVFTGTNTISYTNTCPKGFNLQISSASSDTNLTRTGTDSGTKTLPTISIAGSLTDNTWGVSSDGSTYYPIPALGSTNTIFSTSSANTSAKTIDILYGVKADYSIPEGTYTNDIIYTVATPAACLAYTLKFNLNSGTGASGVDYSDKTLDYGTMINLSTYKPTRTGYTFSGWSVSGASGSASFTGSETSVNVNSSNALELTLTALWTPVTYSISYTLNSGSVSGNPTSYTIETASFTLKNPTRTGYTFAGWTGSNGSTKQTSVTISKGSYGNKSYTANWTANTYTLTYNNQSGSGCTSKTGTYASTWGTLCTPSRTGYTFGGWYTGTSGSGTNITASTTVSGNLTVYAKWTLNLLGISYMQDMTSSVCSATSVGTTKTLTDRRDSNTYTVAKLKDGKCWMTQNLRIINRTLNSTYTDMTSGSFTVPASSTSGFSSYNTNNAYLNSTYGGYYTFYTATLGWGTSSVTSGNSSQSICPKNWRLPTGGSSGEFKTLYSNYNSSALMRGSPVNFSIAGSVYDGTAYDQGSYGYYWSSTVYAADYAYYLFLNSSTVDPAHRLNKYYGFSVRCVAR